MKNREVHGMKNTRTYNTWLSMKNRCYCKTVRAYQAYGAKGITVCDRWRYSFVAFYEDMGERPEGMTLDRIDGNGNYEPSNCRWATDSEQKINRGMLSNNTSGVKGVMWHKRDKVWLAVLRFNKVRMELGRGPDKDEMIKVRKAGERKYFGRELDSKWVKQ